MDSETTQNQTQMAPAATAAAEPASSSVASAANTAAPAQVESPDSDNTDDELAELAAKPDSAAKEAASAPEGNKKEAENNKDNKEENKEAAEKTKQSTDPRTLLSIVFVVALVIANLVIVGLLAYFTLIADSSVMVTADDLEIEEVDQGSLEVAREQFEARSNNDSTTIDEQFDDVLDPFQLDNETPSVIEP